MRIVEFIGREGVRTTTHDAGRMWTPKAGDLIEWPSGQLGMIDSTTAAFLKSGQAHVCASEGSAFWKLVRDVPHVDISGGPFLVIELVDLKPATRMHRAHFWNWADAPHRADNGVDYYVDRPVFRYTGDKGHYAINDTKED